MKTFYISTFIAGVVPFLASCSKQVSNLETNSMSEGARKALTEPNVAISSDGTVALQLVDTDHFLIAQRSAGYERLRLPHHHAFLDSDAPQILSFFKKGIELSRVADSQKLMEGVTHNLGSIGGRLDRSVYFSTPDKLNFYGEGGGEPNIFTSSSFDSAIKQLENLQALRGAYTKRSKELDSEYKRTRDALTR